MNSTKHRPIGQAPWRLAATALATLTLGACGSDTRYDYAFVDDKLALAPAQPAAFKEPAAGTSQYQLHLDTATANAGTEFAGEQRRQWCYSVENAGAPPELADQTVVPITRLFDNLYFTGRRTVGQYVLKTTNGYFLLDALNTLADARDITVPGLTSVGIDPASLKGIMPTHGHGDHYNGAKHMQDTYGGPVYTGTLDAAAFTPANTRNPFSGSITTTLIDNSVLTPQTLTVDGVAITVLSTPGHTAGTLSGVLPAVSGGKTYKLIFWGGTGTPTTVAPAKQYLEGTERTYQLARSQNVDGTIHTHAFVDGSLAKVDKIRNGASPDKNPFLIGNASTLRSLSVLRECAAAKVNALDATVINPVWLTTTIELRASALDGVGNRNVSGLVRVQDPYGPVAGAPVTLSLEGASETCTATTDSQGVASCAFLTEALADNKVVKASFAGLNSAAKVRLASVGEQTIR